VPAFTAAAALPDRIDDALARFDFRAATDAIWQVVLAGNRTLEHERPWELGRRPNDPVIRARLNTVLAALVHTCRILAEQCTPFIPDGAARLLRQLGTGTQLGPVGPPFARLDTSTPNLITNAS
jgi:methionyl-tRNA synthetase